MVSPLLCALCASSWSARHNAASECCHCVCGITHYANSWCGTTIDLVRVNIDAHNVATKLQRSSVVVEIGIRQLGANNDHDIGSLDIFLHTTEDQTVASTEWVR